MEKLHSMAVFVKTVELGSFSATAEALNLSPQMVAKHIASLEAQLANKLIHRTTRRHSLTDVGRAYYQRCKQILLDIEAADAMASDMLVQPKGVLKVSAPLTFGVFSLPNFISQFLARYPEVSINLSLNDRFIDPLVEDIEVMIRIGDLGNSGLIARRLADEQLLICAAPSYLHQRPEPMTPADLSTHECLIFGQSSLPTPTYWQFQHQGKSISQLVQGRLRSNSGSCLIQAALSGIGIMLAPARMVAPAIADGRLVQLLPQYCNPAKPMHVLYPASHQPTAKVSAFVNALLESFGDTPSL
ncbi:LysR family transcriptional regulator [Vitreoscilla massiliensis]|uniref:LysR family transcriptional regulator n=1 Tax=Vitreoscilla massiliensis TaxID=1689272 RepID=A0ABY4E1P0_9NEIS|nr:LysR family transcriptional regulator [Vitreoscilla massiliensis]UOO89447.1 LysR family transcriptional regulator [Vitreoscilla massiliensis]